MGCKGPFFGSFWSQQSLKKILERNGVMDWLALLVIGSMLSIILVMRTSRRSGHACDEAELVSGTTASHHR
jgi:hypothetical protein